MSIFNIDMDTFSCFKTNQHDYRSDESELLADIELSYSMHSLHWSIQCLWVCSVQNTYLESRWPLPVIYEKKDEVLSWTYMVSLFLSSLHSTMFRRFIEDLVFWVLRNTDQLGIELTSWLYPWHGLFLFVAHEVHLFPLEEWRIFLCFHRVIYCL